VLAYLLNPQTVGDDKIPYLSAAEATRITLAQLLHYCTDPVQAYTELNDFRKKQNLFEPKNPIWQFTMSIATFWDAAASIAPCIGQVARRLACTPSNTVPAERSFSNMKVIHTAKRNSIAPARVKKLMYVYMNSRVLARIEAGQENNKVVKIQGGAQQEVEDESFLVEVEDEMISMGENGENNPVYTRVSMASCLNDVDTNSLALLRA